MKRTKDRLLVGASRRLLKTAFAGILAGAMIAMTAMPAFAEGGMLDFTDLEKIEASDDTFSLNMVFKYSQGTTGKTSEIADDVASQIKLRVYKLADLTRESDAEDFHYMYIDDIPRLSRYASADNADSLVEALKADDGEVPALVGDYDTMYNNHDLDDADFEPATLNQVLDLDGTGLIPCGIYYIHAEYPDNGDHFSINGTEYTLQSAIITVPNILESGNTGHQKDSGTHHEITVCPKPALGGASTPTPPPGGNTPPGGGGNPPRGGRRVPPSEGSVLGASRDQMVPPEVLGANRLPQTGQLWWPVPVLCILGLGLIGSGVHRRRAALAVH